MGDMAEVFNDMRAAQKARRRSNTQSSTSLLQAKGIPFERYNSGAHLIIRTTEHDINFWPSTGLWHLRNKNGVKVGEGRGVRPLLAFLNKTGEHKCQ